MIDASIYHATIYVLCTLTSLTCAILLMRAYLRTRGRLLFWSSICFLALSFENALVYVDFVVMPGITLSMVRNSVSLIGLLLLIYGFIWDV